MDIKVVPLDYLAQMRLAEKLAYPGMAGDWWKDTLHAASVREIDGVEVPKPSSEVHIRDIIRRLDDDGMAYVQAEHFKYREPGDPPAYVVKKLNALERWDLKRMANQFWNIPAWASVAYMACMVRSVDAAALGFPKDLDELYARVKTMGVHGLGAAARALRPEPKEDEDADAG